MNETFLGENLEEFHKKVREAITYARKSKNLHAEGVALAAHMGISHMLGDTESAQRFDTELVTETDFIRACEARDDYAAIAFFRLLQAQNFYFLKDLKNARSAIRSRTSCGKVASASRRWTATVSSPCVASRIARLSGDTSAS